MSDLERRKINRVLMEEVSELKTKIHELEIFVTNGLHEATTLTRVVETKLQGIEEAVRSLKSTLIGVNTAFVIAFLSALLSYILK